jgi:mercuric ion binding protein
MNRLIKVSTVIVMIIFFIACNGGIQNKKVADFKVWGNCGMCKKTIEKSLEKDGITADWNKKTKKIHVEYDSVKYTNEQIHAMIADAGYDTDMKRGNDAAYENLHSCCKYERRKD